MHNRLASTSGQLPRIERRIVCCGHLGRTVTLEEGVGAARICALNALAVLEPALGRLDRVERLVRVVTCAPDFAQQQVVIDGASRALLDVFGDEGRQVALDLELTIAFSYGIRLR